MAVCKQSGYVTTEVQANNQEALWADPKDALTAKQGVNHEGVRQRGGQVLNPASNLRAAGGAHPPLMWLMFPRSLLPASHTEGGGNGGKKRHNNLVKPCMTLILQVCIRKHPRVIIQTKCNMFTIPESKVTATLQNLEARWGVRMLMLTRGKSDNKVHVSTLCICKIKNKKPWQFIENSNANTNDVEDWQSKRKRRATGGQHCTIIIRLCKWEKVMLWILPCKEQENTSHRMALYLLTRRTPVPAGNTARRCSGHLSCSQVDVPNFFWGGS